MSVSRQRLFAHEDGVQWFVCDCVTGDSNRLTDVGRFREFRKERLYTSHTYQVPMKYALLFAEDGTAIHESQIVGPLSFLKALGLEAMRSHGCVRLAHEDAVALFDWARIGTTEGVVP